MESKGIVAVIGSGLVGKSWALIFARAGYEVKLFDVIPNVRELALPWIQQTAGDLEKIGLLKKSKTAEEVVNRISFVTSLTDALSGAIWSQECVPENLKTKTDAYIQIDNALTEIESKSGTTSNIILGSSTSAIPCSAFTKDIKHKSQCLVVHPVNPPHLIPVVEIVPAPHTSNEVTQRAYKFMEEVGQSPVHVKKEVDSFVINRLQGALLNEAFKLVEDGIVSPDDLDKTIRDGLGLRWSFMGPFETIDLNAPGGVRDYVERYANNHMNLAKQQSDVRKWEGKVVDVLEEDRRKRLPVEKLGERATWRNERLMGLMAHKADQERKDEEKK